MDHTHKMLAEINEQKVCSINKGVSVTDWWYQRNCFENDFDWYILSFFFMDSMTNLFRLSHPTHVHHTLQCIETPLNSLTIQICACYEHELWDCLFDDIFLDRMDTKTWVPFHTPTVDEDLSWFWTYTFCYNLDI